MVREIVEPAGYTHMFLTPRPNRKVRAGRVVCVCVLPR